jgi:hypothetical protein
LRDQAPKSKEHHSESTRARGIDNSSPPSDCQTLTMPNSIVIVRIKRGSTGTKQLRAFSTLSRLLCKALYCKLSFPCPAFFCAYTYAGDVTDKRLAIGVVRVVMRKDHGTASARDEQRVHSPCLVQLSRVVHHPSRRALSPNASARRPSITTLYIDPLTTSFTSHEHGSLAGGREQDACVRARRGAKQESSARDAATYAVSYRASQQVRRRQR